MELSSTRPTWDEYFLTLADSVSHRADCTRRKVGAVIVDYERRVISTGYNGAPPGKPGCLSDRACPRGRHYMAPCMCGKGSMCCETPRCAGCAEEWPCPGSVPHGSSYDTGAGACIAVHAEANAVIFARQSLKGCTIYVTDIPCDGCNRLIEASGIVKAVYRHDGQSCDWYYGNYYGEVGT